MYLAHFSGITVLQNALIPSASSRFVTGLVSLQTSSFSSCQSNSIDLQSGLSEGVTHQFIPFWTMKFFAFLNVCFGSFSCWNQCVTGNFSWMNGRRVLLKMLMCRSASMQSSKIQTQVGPLKLMPAQTCILSGCLGLLAKKKQVTNTLKK